MFFECIEEFRADFSQFRSFGSCELCSTRVICKSRARVHWRSFSDVSCLTIYVLCTWAEICGVEMEVWEMWWWDLFFEVYSKFLCNVILLEMKSFIDKFAREFIIIITSQYNYYKLFIIARVKIIIRPVLVSCKESYLHIFLL